MGILDLITSGIGMTANTKASEVFQDTMTNNSIDMMVDEAKNANKLQTMKAAMKTAEDSTAAAAGLAGIGQGG